MQSNENQYEDDVFVPERIVSPEMAECYLELSAVIAKMRRHGIQLVIRQEFDFDDDDMPFRQTTLALESKEAGCFGSVVTHTEQLFEEPDENLFLKFDSTFESEIQTLAVKLLKSFPYCLWQPNPLYASFEKLLDNPWMPHGQQIRRFTDDYIKILNQTRQEQTVKSSDKTVKSKK